MIKFAKKIHQNLLLECTTIINNVDVCPNSNASGFIETNIHCLHHSIFEYPERASRFVI